MKWLTLFPFRCKVRNLSVPMQPGRSVADLLGLCEVGAISSDMRRFLSS
jgi:hypothetical protein